MPTEPKPDAPTYYWLRHCKELQDLLDPSDTANDTVLDFLFNTDCEFLTVADFCTVEPGNPEPITLDDMASGAVFDKFKQAARQAAFYKLCQDA